MSFELEDKTYKYGFL